MGLDYKEDWSGEPTSWTNHWSIGGTNQLNSLMISGTNQLNSLMISGTNQMKSLMISGTNQLNQPMIRNQPDELTNDQWNQPPELTNDQWNQSIALSQASDQWNNQLNHPMIAWTNSPFKWSFLSWLGWRFSGRRDDSVVVRLGALNLGFTVTPGNSWRLCETLFIKLSIHCCLTIAIRHNFFISSVVFFDEKATENSFPSFGNPYASLETAGTSSAFLETCMCLRRSFLVSWNFSRTLRSSLRFCSSSLSLLLKSWMLLFTSFLIDFCWNSFILSRIDWRRWSRASSFT